MAHWVAGKAPKNAATPDRNHRPPAAMFRSALTARDRHNKTGSAVSTA